MKSFKKTTSFGFGRGSHYHIAYLNSDDGIGYLSLAKDGHTHEVQYIPFQPAQPAQEPQFDEMGNQLTEGTPEVPSQPEQWIVLPSEDGHTHELIKYDYKRKSEKEPDDDIVKDVIALYREGRELEADSRKDAEIARSFLESEQWDEEAKNFLEGLNRACLTFNVIRKHFDLLCGVERERRTDIQATPQESSDQARADLYSILIKRILNDCYFHREKSEVFEDQAGVGRGFFNIYVDFSQNLEGEIKVEKFPEQNIVLGPHLKKDLSDCEYLLKEKMFSMAKLKQLYPDKADQIEADFEYYLEPKSKEHTTHAGDQYAHSPNWERTPLIVGDVPMVSLTKKEYRVLECWRKVYEQATVFVDVKTKFVFRATDWKESDIKLAETIPVITAISQMVTRLRVTKVAGSIVLSDENPAKLPVDDFFIVPAYCYKSEDRYWGKVRDCIDAQRDINKKRSLVIDYSNRCLAGGEFYDDNTFSDSNDKEKWLRQKNSPGWAAKVSDVTNVPVPAREIRFPSELITIQQEGERMVSDQMNIWLEPGGANESGQHLMHREKTKIRGNEFLFDNLKFAQEKLGRLLIRLIQKYYSTDRIYRIVSAEASKEELMLGGKPFEEFTYEEIEEIVSVTDVEKFDISIIETDLSPTTQMGTYLLVQDLVQAGAPVPPQMLIELNPYVPRNLKTKLLEALAQSQQMESQGQVAQADAEVEKTLVAKGVVPPALAERMGIPAQLGGEIGGAEGAGQPSPSKVMRVSMGPDGKKYIEFFDALPPEMQPQPEGELPPQDVLMG